MRKLSFEVLLCAAAVLASGVLTPANGGLIEYGEVIADAIDPVGDTDTFTFWGETGEKAVVQATSIGSGSASVDVYGPGGGNPIASGVFDPRLAIPLAETGVFTIVVYDFGNDETMDYAIALERAGPPSPNAVAVAPGQTVSGEIELIGDLDEFSFEGVAGEKFVAQVTSLGSGSACVVVYRPDGSEMASAVFDPRLDILLDQTGVYTILVYDFGNDETMTYAVALERAAPPSPNAASMCPGDMLTDEIEVVGDLDLFWFSGAAGDTAIIQATSPGSGSSCVVVYRPDGSKIASAVFDPRIEIVLDQDGPYAILVYDFGNDETMDYTLSYECIGQCPCDKGFLDFFNDAVAAGTLEGTGSGTVAETRLWVMGYVLTVADLYTEQGMTIDAIKLLVVAYLFCDDSPNILQDLVTGEAAPELNDKILTALIDLVENL